MAVTEISLASLDFYTPRTTLCIEKAATWYTTVAEFTKWCGLVAEFVSHPMHSPVDPSMVLPFISLFQDNYQRYEKQRYDKCMEGHFGSHPADRFISTRRIGER